MASSASASPSSTPIHTKTNTASKVYLYTFLATLCLLLAVSGSIVVRSYRLRRRYQRRIEQAIAVGAHLTPQSLGSRRRQFASKPKFYNAWVDYGPRPKAASDGWENITPISANFLSTRTESSTDANEPSTESTLDTRLRPTEHSRISPSPRDTRSPLLSLPFRSRQDHVHRNDLKSEHPDQDSQIRKLQVSVLVAMPTPRSSPKASVPVVAGQTLLDTPEHNDIPNVVIGVVRVPYTSTEAL